MLLRATLVVESNAGRAEQIPPGAFIRIRTDAGTCAEIPLPEAAVSAVSGGGQAILPDITVPVATERPNCGVPEKPVGFELALPDGRTIILLVTTWSPVEQPAAEAPVPSLPATGTGANGSQIQYWLVILLSLGALLLAGGLWAGLANRRASQ